MSYQTIDALTGDPAFAARIRACSVQQAEVYLADARPDFVALAEDQITGGITYLAFVRIAAAGPGFADTAGDPPDQAAIPDADILASVQGSWQTVAGLYFDESGAPIDV